MKAETSTWIDFLRTSNPTQVVPLFLEMTN